jgi:hypothetical protein
MEGGGLAVLRHCSTSSSGGRYTARVVEAICTSGVSSRLQRIAVALAVPHQRRGVEGENLGG